ncbi:MAG: hypothetical protein H6Q55_2617 [Deltaproteobacteria bacterium]|nr:hypothetical protein [Deltaproteobacteria bacterium]
MAGLSGQTSAFPLNFVDNFVYDSVLKKEFIT